jgi:hypothetical protein
VLGAGVGSGVAVGEALTGPDEVGVGVGVAVSLGRADLLGCGLDRVGDGVGVTEVRLGDGAAVGVDCCVLTAGVGSCVCAAAVSGGLA